MLDKKTFILKNIFDYVVLCLIFKYCNYIIAVNIYDLQRFPLIFIPIDFLVIKNIFIKQLEKKCLQKSECIIPITFSYTAINLILKMLIVYTICLILFLIILKDDKNLNSKKTYQNIMEYYKNKK